jgi:hypothetical protein
MARDRGGYATRFTRDDIVRRRLVADTATLGAVADYTLDGTRAGAQAYRVRGQSRHETRFALKTTEFEIAARALAKLGYRDLAFTAGEQPDWRIDVDGGTVVAEVSEINPSALFTNRIADLNVALRDAVDADSTLPIAGHYLAFTFGARAFAHGQILNAAARRAVLAELLAYLAAGTFVTGRITGYQKLEAFDVMVHASAFQPAYVSLELPATSFSPTGPLTDVFARVQRKINDARNYDRTNPLWLFLGITDMLGVFTETVMQFGQTALASGPFERVIVSDGLTVKALPQ